MGSSPAARRSTTARERSMAARAAGARDTSVVRARATAQVSAIVREFPSSERGMDVCSGRGPFTRASTFELSAVLRQPNLGVWYQGTASAVPQNAGIQGLYPRPFSSVPITKDQGLKQLGRATV